MLREIIQQNFMSTIIVLFLIIFIVTNSNFDKLTNHLFLASALCVLILIIEETWEFQLAQQSTYSSLRVVLSAIGYTLRPTTAYFLVMIILRKTPRHMFLMSIPLIINMFVSFSSLFNNWAFSYTMSNKFVRGPLGYIPFIVAGFYVAVLLYKTIRERCKGGRIEAMTISGIAILTIVATLMESVFGFRMIQCGCSGISITFFYLFLHTNQNNRDPLTGCLTRRKFYLDANKYEHSLTAIISLDLNDLKVINDQFGHLEGDKALVTVTDIIRKCIYKNQTLYRIGGDEFMILCYRMNEDSVKQLIQDIQEDIHKTRYSCAIGYAMHNLQDKLDSTCQIADHAMYQNKIEIKKS